MPETFRKYLPLLHVVNSANFSSRSTPPPYFGMGVSKQAVSEEVMDREGIN